MTNTNTTKTAAKTPVFRKKLPFGISSAVFENEYEGRTYRSVNIQRSYRKNNQWTRMSMYLDHEHIPFMIEVLQGTWEFLNAYPASSNIGSEAEPIDTPTEDPISDAIPEFDA